MLEFEFLIIEDLQLSKIPYLAAQIGSMAPGDGFVIRTSIYSNSLDSAACPIMYSREKHIHTYDKQPDSSLNLNWIDIELPNLITAYNSVELASQESLLLLLWCR